MLKVFLVFLVNIFYWCNAQQPYAGLQIPPIACPNYFQYLQQGRQYIGKLTLPSTTNDIDIVLHFSQRQPLQMNNYGKISLFEDQQTTFKRIQQQQPLSYKIEFPIQSEVPKLTRVRVNDRDICIADEYARPSTRLYLNFKFKANTQTHRQTIKAPPSPTNPTQFSGNGNVVYFQGISPNNFFNSPHVNLSQPLVQFTQSIPAPFPIAPVATRPVATISECGQDAGVSAFIFGGDEVMRGQFPWLTAIYVKSAGLRFLCGGSLITTRTVISAGHCFQLGGLSANRLVVNIGRHNLEDYSETGYITREIQNLLVHPEYNVNIFPDADLALLQMQKPVEYTNFIRPICLWAESADLKLIVGANAVVAGWGADESGRTYSSVPKKVNTNVVSDSECLASSQAYSMLTSPRTFCAGNRDGSGPCMGDSGSGLMINRNGKWYLRGVVSAGQTKQQKCNLLEFVVFCDVAKHLQWIRSNTVP